MALNDFTLVGDSQLRRFAKFCGVDDRLCFSGCTISELKIRLKGCGTLPQKVILLIGTNALMKSATKENLKKDYISLVKYLLRNCDKIILIVCPIIPRKRNELSHWNAVNYLNSLIYFFHNNAKISIIDLKTDQSNMLLKPHFFEKRFYDGRTDLIHLNRNAFQFLLSHLRNIVNSS